MSRVGDASSPGDPPRSTGGSLLDTVLGARLGHSRLREPQEGCGKESRALHCSAGGLGGGVVANMLPLNQVHRCLRGRRRRGQRSAGFAIPCASGGHAARGALHLRERCPGRRRRAGQRLELAPHPCVLAGGSPFRLWAWAPPTPSGSSA